MIRIIGLLCGRADASNAANGDRTVSGCLAEEIRRRALASALRRIFAVVVAGATVLFAVRLLLAALYAFSRLNFLMSDYGVYTNVVYNLSRGDGFRFLVDHNYMLRHLSLSLALLAPLVWVWDSPLLLIFVQWLFLVGGAAILQRILARMATPPALQAALLFFWAAYPYTQSVLLSEFHGVAAFLFLVPWLLHTLLFNRRMAALPLVCILGIRQEAGLLVLPLLMYFALFERWKPGYLLAGLTAAYVFYAIFVLYPWVNGVCLFAFRSREASWAGIHSGFTSTGLLDRARATAWLLLPTVPFFFLYRRAWIRIAIPLVIAWLIAMASGFARQYQLRFHYPASLTALLMVGLVLACRDGGIVDNSGSRRNRRVWILAIWLVVTTLVAHREKGFFLWGGASHPVYAGYDAGAGALFTVSRSIPKDGLLLTNQFLAPYCSMRSDIMTWFHWDPERHTPDWILFRFGEQNLRGREALWEGVASGEYGFYTNSIPYFVLRRGHSTSRNDWLLELFENDRSR